MISYTPLETQKHYTTVLSVANIFKFIETQIVEYLDLKINYLSLRYLLFFFCLFSGSFTKKNSSDVISVLDLFHVQMSIIVTKCINFSVCTYYSIQFLNFTVIIIIILYFKPLKRFVHVVFYFRYLFSHNT